MVTMEPPATRTRVCSWDSEPHPDYNLWTTGNVEEVIPGVPTPLIATMFLRADRESARAMIERFQISKVIPLQPAPYANWVAIFAGRGALNLAWFGAFLATFQTDSGSDALEQYFSSEKESLQSGPTQDAAEAARRRRMAFRSVWPATVAAIDRDNRHTAVLRAAQEKLELTKLSGRQLDDYLTRLERRAGRMLGSHVIISGAAGETLAEAGKLLGTHLGDAFDPAMAGGLTTGLGEIESAMPGFALWEIGRFVASKQALAAAVAKMGAHQIEAALAKPADADWRAFAKRFEAFIAEYGFRGQNEADPSVPTWDEDATFVLSVIKTNAAAPADANPILRAKSGEEARKALEATLGKQLPAAAKKDFEFLSSRAQLYARSRERSKARWVRAARLQRPVVLEMGRRLAALGRITAADDVFYLTRDQLSGAIRRKGAAGFGSVVAARKAERTKMESQLPPEVYDAPPAVAPIAPPEKSGNVLNGAGVSAGVASGKARVITTAAAASESELEAGEVLIAPFTDAAWTPLFVSAAAVVVETGGMLSHAATVAREYGIPAVVAVRGATKFIKNGQRVTVDGAAGVVTLG
jgi:phosphohistidine swiveling domain-containing protein